MVRSIYTEEEREANRADWADTIRRSMRDAGYHFARNAAWCFVNNKPMMKDVEGVIVDGEVVNQVIQLEHKE